MPGWSGYLLPRITITRVAFSFIFADEELPRVMSVESSCEVDQDEAKLTAIFLVLKFSKIRSLRAYWLKGSRIIKK